MRAKLLVTGAVVGIAGVLALVGAAFAQDSSPTPIPEATSTPSPFVQELAEQLDLDVEQVQSAVEAASQNVRHERLNQVMSDRLAKAVEAGRLTQEEADQIKTWWESRPAAADKAIGGFFGHHGPKGHRHKGQMPHMPGGEGGVAQMAPGTFGPFGGPMGDRVPAGS